VTLLTAALLGLWAGAAWAQTPAPFDMSPESDLLIPDPEQEAPIVPPTTVPPPVGPPVVQSVTRYVLPGSVTRLIGEQSRQANVVYLTQAQAEAPARLEFSYQNALVIAPEASNLHVWINQASVASNPIASSASPAAVVVDVPPGLLRPGANTIEFQAVQRHRTDCSIESTYELWTELENASVRLVLDGLLAGSITQLSELPTVGLDETGMTTVRFLNAGLGEPQAVSSALRLVQQLAAVMRVAQLRIEIVDALSTEYRPGILDVVMLPAHLLPPELSAVQPQAMAAPLAALVPLANGANVLAVTGPDWTAVQMASDAMMAQDVTTGPRIDLARPSPTMLPGDTVRLVDLGVETIEFNGRRFTAQLQFELPYDFYAYRYGELELVLDAAYSGDVLPGSEIDIYTNDQIASATPLLRTDGGLLRNTIIRIPMTNLRPGRNDVGIAVNLQTESDLVCSPGWTGQAPTRFVLSNTSQLRLPDYARAAVVPDLRVLAGTGWPYAGGNPVPLALGSGQESLISAMTLLSRIAAASGQVINVEIVPSAALSPERNTMVVMPLSEMPPSVLVRAGLLGTAIQAADGSDPLLDQFGAVTQPGPLVDPTRWVLEKFGLDMADLRILPATDAPFTPEPGTVVFSKVLQPEGGIWTVITATDGAAMRSGAARLNVTANWRQVGGRITTLDPADDQVTVIETSNATLIRTQPFSLANLRVVAANWFSGNILYFTGAIIAAALLLMTATSLMLARMGQGK
jgi:hypothetical protein